MISPADLDRATWLLGPLLIGSFLDVFFQGILYCQFVRYAIRYRDDELRVKIAVLVLAILSTLKTIHSFAIVWILFIRYFTDLDGAIALGYTAWWLTGTVLFVATCDLYVQAYFVRRLYYLSGQKWWVAAPVGVILAFGYAAMCIAMYYITLGASATPLMAPWFAAHYSSVVAGDILMTSAMTYFLMKKRKDVLPQTVGLLTAIIRLTWLSVAPATVCAVLNLITTQIYPGTERLLSAIFAQILPKLYGISMMWTLNARLEMRAAGVKHSTGQIEINESLAFQPASTGHESTRVQMSTEIRQQADSVSEHSDMLHNHGNDTTLKSVYPVDVEKA